MLTEKVPGGYEGRSNVRQRNLRVASIGYCVADLYFSEPAGVREVYSETEGTFLPLSSTELHVYCLKMPDLHHTYYYCENARLVKVETRIKFGILEFLRTETP